MGVTNRGPEEGCWGCSKEKGWADCCAGDADAKGDKPLPCVVPIVGQPVVVKSTKARTPRVFID